MTMNVGVLLSDDVVVAVVEVAVAALDRICELVFRSAYEKE